MPPISPLVFNLAVALGIGLLIGIDRERRKGTGPARSPAGIRTFTLTSLCGAVAVIAGGELLLAVATVGVFALAALAYWRAAERDPGLTTESPWSPRYCWAGSPFTSRHSQRAWA